jgi:hypothetical protein
MDNFTLSVIVGDAIILIMFVLMVVFDKKDKPVATEPLKPAGKRPA